MALPDTTLLNSFIGSSQVVRLNELNKTLRKPSWVLKCGCGREFKAQQKTLLKVNTICCNGCWKMKHPDLSLIGFVTCGGSVIVGEPVKARDGAINWSVRCKCGEIFISREKHITNLNKTCKCKSCKAKDRIAKNRTSLEGRKFGRWFAMLATEIRKSQQIMYECTCDCGKMKLVSGDSLKRGSSKSCGCWQKEKLMMVAVSNSGPNHYNWNGGIRKRKTFRKSSTKFGHLRKYIISRDIGCCICSSVDKLTAHHLDGWNWNVSGRFEETNLVTLCNIHHEEFHKIYLKGDNTKEQFIEFCFNYKFNFDEFTGRVEKYKIEYNFEKMYNIHMEKFKHLYVARNKEIENVVGK